VEGFAVSWISEWWKSITKPTVPELGPLGVDFNTYANDFAARTQETEKDFVVDLGKVKLYLFGSNDRKNAAWRKTHPNSGDTIYFVTVSSFPIEIWADVREEKGGQNKGALVINHLSLGHEFVHALRVIMSGWTLANEGQGILISPDTYAEMK
jgi:hypothetical protein